MSDIQDKETLGSFRSPLEKSNLEKEIQEFQMETIVFNESRGRDGYQVKEDAVNITIFPSSSTQMSDQSRLKIRTYVDYAWESQYNYGRLTATHIDGKFIAYVVKVNHVGAVRVMDIDTKDRVLMKAQKGLVRDVEFMHKCSDIYIGFIDEFGTFYINKVCKDPKTTSLSVSQILKISMEQAVSHDSRRFIWCKFVPEENLSDLPASKDSAYHFAVLQNDVIYAGNLLQIAHSFGEGAHMVSDIKKELIMIDTHSNVVTDASFAPDGTAIATASKDGTVKFFQVYFRDRNPGRCLFSWAPHDGKPIDKIFFLDNHTIKSSSECNAQYWKFMLTASGNMTEIKLFTCKTWECLQTIKFNSGSAWKLDLDVTAQFLVASNTEEQGFFLLKFTTEDDNARLEWVQEFSLPYPMLSFDIRSCSNSTYSELISQGFEEYIAEEPGSIAQDEILTLLEMNFVQPKSLQEGVVAFKPPSQEARPNSGNRISFSEAIKYNDEEDENAGASSSGEDFTIINDDVSIRSKSQTVVKVSAVSPRSMSPKSVLKKTVNASPVPKPEGIRESPNRSSIHQMSQQLSSLIGVSPTSNVRAKSPLRTKKDDVIKRNGAVGKTISNSSSPSREVEEILSPKAPEIHHQQSDITTNLNKILSLSTIETEKEPVLSNGNVSQDIYKLSEETERPSKTQDALPQLPHILDQISSIMKMMEMQGSQIQELNKEMSRLHDISTKQRSDSKIHQLLENHITTNKMQIDRMEETIRQMTNAERLRQSQAQAISPGLVDLVSSQINTCVKKEIEQTLPRALHSLYEPEKLKVKGQIDRLCNVMEGRLSERIAAILMEQNLWESVAAQFQGLTKKVVETTFHDTFLNSVLPKINITCHEMLKQVNDAFISGTREYIVGLEDILEKERKNETVFGEHISQIQSAVTGVVKDEVESKVLRAMELLQVNILKRLEDSLSRELYVAFKEQQKFLEANVPRNVSPAMSNDHMVSGGSSDPTMIRRNLMELVKNKELPTAFVQACSQGDLGNLMYLCKQVNPSDVFTSQLPTQTHLAIIQMLVTDMCGDTDTKLSYLLTALTSLNTSDYKVLQSVARLYPIFQSSASRYLANNPQSKLEPNLKILELAIQGVANQVHNVSRSRSQDQFQ